MKTINFILNAFGFEHSTDFFKSTFGFTASAKVVSASGIFGVIGFFVEQQFGLPPLALFAFVGLIIAEFATGIMASKKKGKKIESRYMGRMLLKIGTYVGILWMLNQFKKIEIPTILGYDLNPFIILYYVFIVIVIWQLYRSLGENAEVLGWKELSRATDVSEKKIDDILDLKNENNTPT